LGYEARLDNELPAAGQCVIILVAVLIRLPQRRAQLP
jgi:hypothetical protein